MSPKTPPPPPAPPKKQPCEHVMEWQKTEWRTTSRAHEFRLIEISVCARCGMTEAQAEAVYSDPALRGIW